MQSYDLNRNANISAEARDARGELAAENAEVREALTLPEKNILGCGASPPLVLRGYLGSSLRADILAYVSDYKPVTS